MKVTFPHMGNAGIALKALFTGLNLEVVPPPPVSRRTMELGSKYSPEFACLPLKINVGNFIEALENGADTVVMAGGWGPCRFGYYAQVERDILNELMFDYQMIILEAPDSRLSELFKQFKSLGENVSLWQALRAIKFAWGKLNAVEKMEKGLEYILPRAADPVRAERIYHQSLAAIDAAGDDEAIRKAVGDAEKNWQGLSRHSRPVIKLGLVGEIYTILEPAANYHLINHLGFLGAEVTRSIYITDWINDHLLGGFIKKSHHLQVINSARPYINYWVGGHGQESVGATVEFARQGYDGVIQIGPLTCMPEIVAHSVLGRVSQVEGIPCMTLYFDEHSGTAGVYTRVEAFVDMLRRQKRVV